MECEYCDGCGVIVTMERSRTTALGVGEWEQKENRARCAYCQGTGQQVFEDCPSCAGNKQETRIEVYTETCDDCNGAGIYLRVDGRSRSKMRCAACAGRGNFARQRTIKTTCSRCDGEGKLKLTEERKAEKQDEKRRRTEETQRQREAEALGYMERRAKLIAGRFCLTCGKPLGIAEKLMRRAIHRRCQKYIALVQ